ncbi:MAG: LysM peptidoglycan-binding domain-containing protein [Cyclobacteriaceae bacterium]
MRKIFSIVFIISFGAHPMLAQDMVEYDFIPDATYDEVADRLSCIESEIPLNYNQRVKSFIDYFTVRDRSYTKGVIARTKIYFPIFEEAFERHGVPKELKYLAIVESGLRPNAISRASAVGLWQFVSSTGKMYGLTGDWYVDDRMDPYESSDAAARHLKDLYRMFDDWELALAAYNCGPGNVRKAIRRSGYKKQFWEIYRYLPRETRSYVPQFVAIAYTLNYAEEHNLFVEEYESLPDFDTITISQYFHLETFASNTGGNLEDLLKLNPHIKRGALPEGTKNFALRIPREIKDSVFYANRTFLYDTAGKVGKAHLDYLARNTPGSTYGRERQVYKVRSGDVLGVIAQRYHVRVSDIRSWNNLNSNMIRVGQRLNIWVLPSYSSQTKDLYTSTARATTSSAQKIIPAGSKTHTVQYGDSLWSIANSYAGLSIDKIKQLNNLSSNTIKPGQQLIISAE